MELSKETWGSYNGETIYLFKLDNGHISVSLTNFGATITRMDVPDRQGNISNIVLGYDDLPAYPDDPFFLGCIVGRVTGRINHAQLLIDGQIYPLAANDGKNIQLHGGHRGFSKSVFTVERESVTDAAMAVTLYYRSAHLEEGYPGNLDLWVTYQLSADHELTITYKATTDQATHLNLTNHSYFNLSGKAGNALNQQLFIDADLYVETGENFIPTGNILSAQNTLHDFKTPRIINEGLPEDFPGFNECFVLNATPGKPAAVLTDPESGRSLSVTTDQPGLLFYSADYLSAPFQKNGGICLETQFFPDTPNHPAFPSTLLRPNEVFESFTRFKLG